MTNKNNKLKLIIKALAHKDHSRYVITSTLSCMLAGSFSLFTPLTGMYLFYLILSSAAAAFYSYGPTLARQTGMILFGIFIGLISCITTSYLSSNIYLSTIALFLIGGILYYYSLKNIGVFL